MFLFLFSSRRRHTRCYRDWSSDVCSSDLVEGDTLADALPPLRETYCGTIAYEIEHISDHEERVWLREAIESGRYRTPLSDDERRALLTRLTEVEGLETFLRRSLLGQKQFSIE